MPHTRPVRVIGTAEDDDLIDRLRLHRSTYEGPTGIVGVLHDALPPPGRAVAVAVGGRAHLRVGPVVADRRPRPRPPGRRAALGAARHRRARGGVRRPTSRRIDEVVADDDDLGQFLDRLEEAYDEEDVGDADPADLIAEVERFLREQ